eukprot:TRINITY_DN136_c0_g1_i6.p1 TRINITY_DN136_c0_g1~~TRINITY_DN136_c0_g1_i6.p1  ORF type:complete len:476 (+),score=52.50 TRINITY_DN136_c0_g1_i6:493-1920(+)
MPRRSKSPSPAMPPPPASDSVHSTRSSMSSPHSPLHLSELSLGAMGERKASDRLGQYRFMETLGEGSYGTVKMVIDRRTNEKYAVKILDKTLMDDAARKRALREISTLARLSHPHIVDFHEAIETDSHIYVIMEYVKNGELFDFIKENGPLPEELAAFFFYQIVEAIAYCHSRNYVHRDLKPENFLLDATWGIKVSDFGFCRHVSPDHARDIRTACGSATYAAPEIFRGQPYDRSVDVWSLGVNLYVLVSGMNPWGEKSYRRQKWRILNAEYAKLDGISPECSDIIARMIKADPESRPSLTQLLTHPWFKRAESRLAEYNMVHNIVRPSLSRGSSRHHSRTPSPTTVRTRIFSSASDGSSRGRASSGGARPSSGLSRGAESASSREQGASSGAHNSSTNRSRDQGAADDSEPPVDDVLSEVLQANRQGTSSVPASDAAPNQTKTQGSIADPQPSTVATPTTTTTTTTTTRRGYTL